MPRIAVTASAVNRADLLQRVMRIWLVGRPDTVIGADTHFHAQVCFHAACVIGERGPQRCHLHDRRG